MSNKKLFELFKLFLEINNAKGSFFYYLKKDDISNKELINVYDESEWINYTFSWNYTRQGHDYWNSLNNKWVKVVTDLRTKGKL